MADVEVEACCEVCGPPDGDDPQPVSESANVAAPNIAGVHRLIARALRITVRVASIRGSGQTGYFELGRDREVHIRPRHISSEEPSPQVMKWGATLRNAGSCCSKVGS